LVAVNISERAEGHPPRLLNRCRRLLAHPKVGIGPGSILQPPPSVARRRPGCPNLHRHHGCVSRRAPAYANSGDRRRRPNQIFRRPPRPRRCAAGADCAINRSLAWLAWERETPGPEVFPLTRVRSYKSIRGQWARYGPNGRAALSADRYVFPSRTSMDTPQAPWSPRPPRGQSRDKGPLQGPPVRQLCWHTLRRARRAAWAYDRRRRHQPSSTKRRSSGAFSKRPGPCSRKAMSTTCSPIHPPPEKARNLPNPRGI